MSVHHEVVQTPASQSFRLLRWEAALADVEVCVRPGQTEPIPGAGERWHAHAEVELTYVESGEGTRFVGDHLGSIRAPELVLLGSNLPHYWSGLRASSGMAVQFDTSLRSGLAGLPELADLAPLWTGAQRGLLFSQRIAVSIGRQLVEMQAQHALGRLGMLANLFEKLRSTDATPLCDKPFTVTTAAPHADAVSRAIQLLVDHHPESLSIEDVSQSVGLSRATLCRYFRRYTGRSMVEFLNGVRIDHARRLLVETPEPIGEIALSVGFGNLSHFNRQFRKAVGQTPRDFRASAG